MMLFCTALKRLYAFVIVSICLVCVAYSFVYVVVALSV